MSELIHEGDRIHVVIRRRFDGDVRRHFVGAVTAVGGNVFRAEGYGFVHDPNENVFVRGDRSLDRLVSLIDAGNLISVLPPHVDLEALQFETVGNRTVLTDGAGFEGGVNEFGPLR